MNTIIKFLIRNKLFYKINNKKENIIILYFMKDFSIKKIEYLLKELKSKSNSLFITSESIPKDFFSSIKIFIRHDIDKSPKNAFKIARLEHELGIHGTYYFRIHPKVFKPEIIKEIAGMGHQIGYHYEDFTKNHGNPEKAIASFGKNLAKLREIVPITTICMDGRPMSKYNNLDLWIYYDYKEYGIDFEPYLDIDFNNVLYITDTGRGWNLLKYNVRDKVRNPFNYHDKTTNELIKDFEVGKMPNQIMITIHPQRWNDNWLFWLRELLLQRIKNMVKLFLIRLRK